MRDQAQGREVEDLRKRNPHLARSTEAWLRQLEGLDAGQKEGELVMASGDCQLFFHTRFSDELGVQMYAHGLLSNNRFMERGATPSEFAEYLLEKDLARGTLEAVTGRVAELLERMLDLTGEMRVERLPDGRYRARLFTPRP